MNKQKFLKVVRHVNTSNGEELAKLILLEEAYPYSAMLHSLVAKISKDQKDKNTQASIHQAALYATDRAVLKELLAGNIQELAAPSKSIEKKPEPTKVVQVAKKVEASPQPTEKTVSAPRQDFVQPDNPTADDLLSEDEAEALRNDVLGNLSTLVTHKENFDKITSNPKKASKAEKSNKEVKETVKLATSDKSTTGKAKSPKGKIAAATKGIAKDIEETTTTGSAKSKTALLVPKSVEDKVAKTKGKSKPTKKSTKRASASNELSKPKTSTKNSGAKAVKKAAPVKTTAVPKKSPPSSKSLKKAPKAAVKTKNTKPDDLDEVARQAIKKLQAAPVQEPKNKEQIELIEKFIKKEPKIPKKPRQRTKPVDQEDLSTGSTRPNEDLVTENLAEIYIMQEKPKKAIDIYKKLIWKFPQKKAFFASQIEKLKKK